MSKGTERRAFLRQAALAGGALLLAPAGVLAQEGRPIPRRPPPLAPARVNAFVRAGHSDLAAVQQMLAEEPGLLNAAWDWGGGDWETALGGASHMGTRPVAEYLLSRGARMDIFCAAMLGRASVVESMLRDNPALAHARGPHGIPVARHAQAGGSQEVLELLRRHAAAAPGR